MSSCDAPSLRIEETGELPMAKNKTRRRSLTNPSDLEPLDGAGKIQVIIETPKGSRNKYVFDSELKIFVLKKVLPAGVTFPYTLGLSHRRKPRTVTLQMSLC
jgi:hypothetical protein